VTNAKTHEELVRFWNESADYYTVNSEMNELGTESHERIAAALVRAEAKSVVDIGCGTGHVASVIAALDSEIAYTGVDVATAAVEGARASGRPGTYLVADTATLPFENASFDAAISLYALEHFTRPEASLQEMARVVRPGGLVAIFSMNYDRPLGTVSSIRFGLRDKPRRHPANVAAYIARRSGHIAKQSLKHVRYAVDKGYTSFQLVERPLVLDEPYQVDFDAVHVVSGESVLRVLEQNGCTIVSSNVPRRLFAKRPVGLEVFAQKR
jgi:ubiquinone/menaquinone biosynthesis C-methylase UbiE